MRKFNLNSKSYLSMACFQYQWNYFQLFQVGIILLCRRICERILNSLYVHHSNLVRVGFFQMLFCHGSLCVSSSKKKVDENYYNIYGIVCEN